MYDMFLYILIEIIFVGIIEYFLFFIIYILVLYFLKCVYIVCIIIRKDWDLWGERRKKVLYFVFFGYFIIFGYLFLLNLNSGLYEIFFGDYDFLCY